MQAFSTWNNNGESIRESLDRANKIMERMNVRPPSPDKFFITNEAWAKLRPHIGEIKADGRFNIVNGMRLSLFESRFEIVSAANDCKDNLASIIAVDLDEKGRLCQLNLAGYLNLLDGVVL